MEDLVPRSIRRENAQPKLLLHEKQRQQLRLQQRRLSQCDEVIEESDSNESCKGDQINLDDYLSSLSGQTLPSSTLSHSVSMSQSWSPAVSTGIKRNPPPTLKEEDEENSWPGSPTNEELPKWLQEARDLKLKKKKERSNGRSLGSNYLDSYLGNLTHHSWVNYAPSTPTTQQNLYMPKRVFLYPDAYYNRKKNHKQQLFMSRSFTEGISDATLCGLTESKRHKGTTPCSDDMTDLTTHSYSEQRDFSSDSPGTDKSISVSVSKDTIEEESFEPPSMNATESGMDTDDLHQTSGVHTSSGSACFSPKSVRVTSVTVTCDTENSIAVDSLEADIPVVTTETSGVVTHEPDEVKDKYELNELTEDEVTISENFPDIPFEHEYTSKTEKSVLSTVVADEVANESIEEKSVSNASDESSSCTQQSTIQIIDCNAVDTKTDKADGTVDPLPTDNPMANTRSVSFASITSPVLTPEDVSCSFSDMLVSDKNDQNDSTKSVLDSNSIRDISLDSVSEPLQETAIGCDTESGKSSSSCETVCQPQTADSVTVLSGERSPATAISSSVVNRVLERKVSLTSITSSVTQSPIDSINSLTSSHIQSSSGISSCSPITPIKPPTSLQHTYSPNFMPLSFPNISSNYGFPSKSATPISSPHRHSTPTTPSSHFGVTVAQKCSSKQHHINALLQLLRVQHHHEREQLVAKQQEEMQQFLQHLQKLTPAQLQHIVSSQVTSVQSNKISNRGTPIEPENKHIAENTSPCDDNYSTGNSQSTPSLSDSKSTPSGNVMPSFYLHNPSNAPPAGKVPTPGHINKLFLSFPSKKKCQSPSQPETPHKAITPNFPKGYTSYTVMGGQNSMSSLDLTRQRHSFSRSQSDTIGTNLLQSKDSCISLPPDIINNIPHTPNNTSHTPSTPFISKPSKQAFNEKQVISNSTRNLKNKLSGNSSGNLLHPLTPREDMADLSSSLTNSDLFNSLHSSLIMESDDKYSKKKKSAKETSKQRAKENPKISATELFMQGLIKLQALVRGDHVRQLLNCQTVQQHIQTLSEVNKLAEQFHKDIMSDNIKKADVDFHRALYHQEECARKEFYRLFIVASFSEQRKVINRDRVVKVATAKRNAVPKRSPSTSRNQSTVHTQSSSRRNVSGSKSNEFLSTRINSEEAKSPRNRNKIPVLSGKNSNNKANSCERPVAAPRVSKQPTIYKHVQSRYLSNLAKKSNYSKAMETSKNARSSRIALPNCSASPVLSASTRRLNEKMCRSSHQTATSQTKHSPPDWQQRAPGRSRSSYQTSFASGGSKHQIQTHRSTGKKYCTTVSNTGNTASDGDRKVSREQLWR